MKHRRNLTGREVARAQGVRPELLESRRLMAATPLAPAPIDGAGNNEANLTWGSAGQTLLRVGPASYGDGVSTPAGANRPSAREVSNVISSQLLDATGEIAADPRFMTAFVYAFGQFIDHDLDLTNPGTGAQKETFNIPVPSGDPSFDPNSTGTKVINLSRSEYDPTTGTDSSNPRQQFNEITAYLDGSVIYGSSAARTAALREFSGGRLKTSAGDLLPFNTDGLPNANDAHLVANDKLFLSGDVRANENIELTAVHTVFLREHNRLAAAYAAADPSLTDEQVFQKARAKVVAELQVVTYNEFLPALIGDKAIKAYKGYDAKVNVGISNEFSTAAYRVGHTMLGDDIEFLDNQGDEVADEVPLSGAFFNPTIIGQTGIDPIVKYLASDPAKFVDAQLVDSVRNFLFGPPGAGGFDLASLNVQRGRDHGLADLNTTRVAFGLPRYNSFAEISSNPTVQAGLEQLYGNVDNIDLWTGGLVEGAASTGGSVGETFKTIIADQFTRIRDGDRYFYRRVFKGAERKELERTTMADLVMRNTTVTNLQADVFNFNASVSGRVVLDNNANGVKDKKDKIGKGIAVSLMNEAGDAVLSTVMTDKKGRFTFGGFHEVGEIKVQCLGDGAYVSPEGGAIRTSKVTKSEALQNVDFFLAPVPHAEPT